MDTSSHSSVYKVVTRENRHFFIPCVKNIFQHQMLSFLYKPQEISIFRETTLWTLRSTRTFCQIFYTLQNILKCILNKGCICTPEPKRHSRKVVIIYRLRSGCQQITRSLLLVGSKHNVTSHRFRSEFKFNLDQYLKYIIWNFELLSN